MNKEEYSKMYALEKENWWFVGKRELVVSLFKQMNTVKNPKMLDIGCGTGIISEELSEFGDLTAIDASDSALKYCSGRGFKTVKMDAEKMKFNKNSFDVVFMLDVLEHFSDDASVLNQISKILKKNGIVIITVPAFKSLWSNHDVVLAHRRRYEKGELRKILKKNFQIIKMIYWNSFLFFPAFLAKILIHDLGLKKLNPVINRMLITLLRFENYLISKNINLPFGVSIVCILKRN
jgi:ubiquinone/menaquinone biosynthesis C-methylase UbiE